MSTRSAPRRCRYSDSGEYSGQYPLCKYSGQYPLCKYSGEYPLRKYSGEYSLPHPILRVFRHILVLRLRCALQGQHCHCRNSLTQDDVVRVLLAPCHVTTQQPLAGVHVRKSFAVSTQVTRRQHFDIVRADVKFEVNVKKGDADSPLCENPHAARHTSTPFAPGSAGAASDWLSALPTDAPSGASSYSRRLSVESRRRLSLESVMSDAAEFRAAAAAAKRRKRRKTRKQLSRNRCEQQVSAGARGGGETVDQTQWGQTPGDPKFWTGGLVRSSSLPQASHFPVSLCAANTTPACGRSAKLKNLWLPWTITQDVTTRTVSCCRVAPVFLDSETSQADHVTATPEAVDDFQLDTIVTEHVTSRRIARRLRRQRNHRFPDASSQSEAGRDHNDQSRSRSAQSKLNALLGVNSDDAMDVAPGDVTGSHGSDRIGSKSQLPAQPFVSVRPASETSVWTTDAASVSGGAEGRPVRGEPGASVGRGRPSGRGTGRGSAGVTRCREGGEGGRRWKTLRGVEWDGGTRWEGLRGRGGTGWGWGWGRWGEQPVGFWFSPLWSAS